MTPNIITKRPTNLLKYMTPKIIIITKPPKVCTYLLSRYIWNISIKKRNKDNTKSRIYKCFGLHSNLKNMEYTNLVMVSLTLANKKTVLVDILWEVKIFRNYQGPPLWLWLYYDALFIHIRGCVSFRRKSEIASYWL